MAQQAKQQSRKPKGMISSLATNFVHARNPYTMAWWSAAFPGFGHISLGSYVVGFLLFIWEMVVNSNAKINLAIFYSFTGQYELAKEAVNNKWLLLYAPVFVYGVWSCYCLTLELNRLNALAERNGEIIRPVSYSFYEINILDKRVPWVSVAWTLLTPGLGHLYTHRIPTGFFLLVWWIAIVYLSNLLPCVQLTAFGNFEAAKAVVDIEYLVYMPSILGFALYDVYVNTVEYNRLYEKEQAKFLEREYQHPNFDMPV
ncbi:hypothetical protein H1S01_17590 [Heliobacterium chlorum]|uniref:Uncharacterized protein n=1 Tax=Heliobacterium chlorum TaxID=2698 RepID=A0ABR7T676_HELCL|nr:hypothetical protein [Heliobacterium chlorum]MBC9786274.1 hypothetical protein [Heliobacterium chlorum]